MTPALEARGLTKRYGSLAAVDDVTFTIAENAITGLLGRNGAGKTTLMRLITGQEFPTSGSVRLFGAPPVENAAVLQHTCFIAESQRYPDEFRVKHVLAGAPRFFANWDAEFADELVDEFRLSTRQRIKKLSRGQRSAVGVIVGLASRAPLTIFDEPYLGLDAVARQIFYDRLLADYGTNPRTVILSTHLIDEVSQLLEHALVIDSGRIVIDAPVDELRSSAATVSGTTEAVNRFTAGREVAHREQLGGLQSATVSILSDADREAARSAGLEVGPVSLQQLIVRRTGGFTTAPTTIPEEATA
ncbi:MAG: ABC transporter ATP-binding protein [Microcella sp.]|uniref:ABC transporter ATP-binding protein n=1 Tax=Microcella sp. TaxID=1913979 RepID=UPI00331534E1